MRDDEHDGVSRLDVGVGATPAWVQGERSACVGMNKKIIDNLGGHVAKGEAMEGKGERECA